MIRSSRATLPFLLLGPLWLAGCSHPAKTFGLEVTPPNAYEVGTEAPLSMPPDLQVLPAPEPGAPRPQQVSASNEAQEILAPQTATQSNATMGSGQQALLQQAGPAAPPNIRATVNRQAELESRSPGFIGSLMSFKRTGDKGVLVNAPAEQKRLQENAALGEPVTKGATPKAPPPAPKGFFNRLLGIF